MAKRGRPSTYNEALPDKMRVYARLCLSKKLIPWIEEFCTQEEISERTLRDWCKTHDEMAEAREYLMTIQKMILKQLCISKGVHATGPIFLLKANHGFIETEKVQHVGNTEEPLTLIFTDSDTFKKHQESVKRLEAQNKKSGLSNKVYNGEESEKVGGYDWSNYSNNR